MDAIPKTRLLLTLAAYAGLAATAAFAQPPGGPPRGRGFGPPGGPGGGMGMLLQSPEVRDELELLDDQLADLQDLQDDMREQIRDAMRNGFRQGRGNREAMREQMEAFREEAETKLAAILTTQQMDRLKQINTQQMVNRGGGRSLLQGPLADELGLTDEQKAELREKAVEVQAQLRDKMAEARKEAQEELLTVLTSEQREKLQTLMGEPFDLPERQGPPGFNRGDRGGRGGEAGPPGGRRGPGRGGRGPQGPPPGDEL